MLQIKLLGIAPPCANGLPLGRKARKAAAKFPDPCEVQDLSLPGWR